MGVTVERVVWGAIVCSAALAWFVVTLYLKTGKPESPPARLSAAPAKRETGALLILKSDLATYTLVLWVAAGMGWLVTRGVTVGAVVFLAAGCFVALACFVA